jgi:hypothetical protein
VVEINLNLDLRFHNVDYVYTPTPQTTELKPQTIINSPFNSLADLPFSLSAAYSCQHL